MSNYATNEDILDLVGGEIFDHGVEDFTDELGKATADVKRYIEVNWFNQSRRQGYTRPHAAIGNEFDGDLLTAGQWKHSTIYLAMYRYILPRLSPFRENDSFTNKITFYRERYHEEIKEEMAKGVEYDANDDGTIQSSEKHRFNKTRVYR